MPNRNIAGRQGLNTPQPLLAPNWWLGLVPRQYWNKKKSYFVYEADFLPINNLAAASVNIQVQNDSHFLCLGITSLITDNTNTTVINAPSGNNAAGKLIQITDVAAGFPLSNTPIPIENITGTGMLPGLWAIPKLFRKGTTIGVALTNLLNAQHNVRISFNGVRIYPDVPAEQS